VEVQESWSPDRFSLWRTDGTLEGSFRLMDLGSATGWVTQARGFQGKTYFPADDGVHGVELWVTDGTIGGTRLLKDLTAGANSSFPGLSMGTILPTGGFIEFNGKLYFGAGGPEFSDHVLWVTDGTPEGTKPLVNLPGTDPRAPKLPAAYCVVGDTLYFSAQTLGNSPFTRQLWRTDGTQDGTRQVTSFDFGETWNPIWSILPSPRP
jgi:ELWxxDGT repeat protein